MIIEVKKKHITAGIQESPCNCPIAQAIKEALGIDPDANQCSPNRVEVDDDSIDVYFNSCLSMEFACPTRAVKFINSFDKNGKKAVSPETFKFVKKNV